jgi:hypothetical protein
MAATIIYVIIIDRVGRKCSDLLFQVVPITINFRSFQILTKDHRSPAATDRCLWLYNSNVLSWNLLQSQQLLECDPAC